MWRDPRMLTRRCPQCNRNFNLEVHSEFTWTCKKCGEVQEDLRCDACKSTKRICENCSFKGEQPKLVLKEKFDGVPRKSSVKFYSCSAVATILLLIFAAFYYKSSSKEDKNIEESNLIKKLKEMYPSQRAETWYHFLSVLENKDLVKSITLLYNEDRTTSNCLVSELVSRFRGSKNIKIEEITFSDFGFEGMDYGLVLEHYHAIVKKFRVFTADLTNIPGKHARIFHSLCDEVSSDVKPSLFIFTIKCSNRTENLIPMERATTALKEYWNDLSDNELSPLLSRVIKNVVEIIPEAQNSCIKTLKSSSGWNLRMPSVLQITYIQTQKDLNLEIIPEYAKYLHSHGIRGILVNGTTGEGVSMTVAERKKVLEAWMVSARQFDQTVMVQIGGTNMQDVKHLARHAEECEVSSILCLADLFFRPSNVDELIHYLRIVSAEAPRTPLLYYHIPGFTGININMAELLERSSEIPTFVGIKFTDNDLVQGSNCVSRNLRKSVFSKEYAVFLGCDNLFLSGLILGFDSAIGTTINIFPEDNSRILRYFQGNNFEEAANTQKTLNLKIQEILKYGSWVSSMKAAMRQVTGINVGPVREPLLNVSQINMSSIFYTNNIFTF